MAESKRKKQERRLTYVTLSGTFLSIFAIVNLFVPRRKRARPSGLELAMLGFATYRMGRMMAYDKVMESYRSYFTRTVPDQSGAGESVEPRGSGVQQAIGELLSCPICSGTWVAALLVYGLHIAPAPTRMMLMIMSAIGMGELLNSATEAFSWFGQAARDEAGLIEEGKMPVAPLPESKPAPRKRTTTRKKSGDTPDKK